MFRLVENVMTVVVTDRIKKTVETAGINTFAFKDSADWAII